ncbi:MAG: hypothetical protein JXB42_06645 [Deltaproteobacteria bacterium]|nr:hypothetical protein [Deltaproteobacteria bacterium]
MLRINNQERTRGKNMGFRKSFIVLAAVCLTCGVCIFALSESPSINEEVIRQKRDNCWQTLNRGKCQLSSMARWWI